MKENNCNHSNSEREVLMKTYDYLLNFHIKPSVQRLAIMDYLLTHCTHPSIEEIYLALCNEIPTLSKTTVYNTLKLFVEHGAAQMLTIDERNVCYDSDLSLHAHFLCKRCNKIFDLLAPMVDEQVEKMKSEGFQMEDIHYYYKGICPKCKGENNSQSN